MQRLKMRHYHQINFFCAYSWAENPLNTSPSTHFPVTVQTRATLITPKWTEIHLRMDFNTIFYYIKIPVRREELWPTGRSGKQCPLLFVSSTRSQFTTNSNAIKENMMGIAHDQLRLNAGSTGLEFVNKSKIFVQTRARRRCGRNTRLLGQLPNHAAWWSSTGGMIRVRFKIFENRSAFRSSDNWLLKPLCGE